MTARRAPSARARIDDIVQVVAVACVGALGAAFRRLIGRGRRSNWGWGLELTIAASRGSWSVMPRIGTARWRSVSEALLPLRTDGLEPRWLRDEPEPPPFDGAWLDPRVDPKDSDGADGPVILYIHGGGFAFCSLRSHGTLIGSLARAAGARTLALEHRLAPEHPAWAAHDDVLAAWHFLLSKGIPPKRIVLAGDSSGGTLVLATLLALRDAGQALPAAGVAISPCVDFECSGASFQTNTPFDYVSADHVRLGAAGYFGDADRRDPRISTLFADLSGLPPLLLQAGGREVLVDQVREFSARAAAAGVDVRLSVYDDMVHVWHIFGGITPETPRAFDEIGAFVREHTNSPRT